MLSMKKPIAPRDLFYLEIIDNANDKAMEFEKKLKDIVDVMFRKWF